MVKHRSYLVGNMIDVSHLSQLQSSSLCLMNCHQDSRVDLY